MRKVNSVIKNVTSHFTMENKNVLRKEVFTKSGFIRVGNYLWIFGGFQSQSILGTPKVNHDKRKTMLWHIQKQRWIWGPDVPIFYSEAELQNDEIIHQGSSGVAIRKHIGWLHFLFPSSLCKG